MPGEPQTEGDEFRQAPSKFFPGVIDRYYTRLYSVDHMGVKGHDQYVFEHANGLVIVGIAESHALLKKAREGRGRGGEEARNTPNDGSSSSSASSSACAEEDAKKKRGLPSAGEASSSSSSSSAAAAAEEEVKEEAGLESQMRVSVDFSDRVRGASVIGKRKRGALRLHHSSQVLSIRMGDSVWPVYMGIDGELIEYNERLLQNPQLIIEDPETSGWILIAKVNPGLLKRAKRGFLDSGGLRSFLESGRQKLPPRESSQDPGQTEMGAGEGGEEGMGVSGGGAGVPTEGGELEGGGAGGGEGESGSGRGRGRGRGDGRGRGRGGGWGRGRGRGWREKSSIAVLREAFRSTQEFVGLEEPPGPLPHFAHADLAVRPKGYTEDLWLPVQVKSTRRQNRFTKSASWKFRKVCGYGGMAVVCISLERGLEQNPKVWLFPGEYFEGLKGVGSLRITEGGKHDRKEAKCSFSGGSSPHEGQHVGQALYEIWHQAQESGCTYRLQNLITLQTQLSPTHLREWEILQRSLKLFECVPGGMEVRDSLYPSLPHDIEIRLAGSLQPEWKRVQLKSSHWMAGQRFGAVNMNRRLGARTLPYTDCDFDFLLVSSPQNGQSLQTKDVDRRLERSSFFFIPMFELVKEGVVSSTTKRQKGLTGLSLDFSIDDFPDLLHPRSMPPSIPTKLGSSKTEDDANASSEKEGGDLVISEQEWGEVTERTAVSLLRQSLASNPKRGFAGLEEPSIPQYPYPCKLLVRPIGCTEDLWLLVQWKVSTSDATLAGRQVLRIFTSGGRREMGTLAPKDDGTPRLLVHLASLFAAGCGGRYDYFEMAFFDPEGGLVARVVKSTAEGRGGRGRERGVILVRWLFHSAIEPLSV
uniref:Protein Abitram n=1 Tax=Chromera velia CCMP2878 TaxID=1169474 RepID=A0A0G4GUB2_9ALVE|eukprot:Cvel_23413.t1-p1 / transcript=Cvel_23413.t1 / gene=Cvel_23413 / organism=Chromera_velia_CCMP2878 / gene_product=hypothetical protein / transcript_product=hypothetical protein / location=Cvel_scaffold2410:7994-16735(-) / protein_length=866 / sequence_SO=supercontig / SO=protein_coding / is_pseudo=false